MKKSATGRIVINVATEFRNQTPNAVFGANALAKFLADSCFRSRNGRSRVYGRRNASRWSFPARWSSPAST